MQKIIELIHKIRVMRMIYSDPNMFSLSFFKKMKMNFFGFTADQYTRFNLKENDRNEYISEYERWKARDLNGAYNLILDDKILFYENFKNHINIPTNYGWISNNILFDLKGSSIKETDMLKLIRREKKIVIKPVSDGGSGKGVSILSCAEDSFYLNSKKINTNDVYDYILNNENAIISEYVYQHDYSNKLYKPSVNTIRIITVIENEEVWILDAVHRIGNEASRPVDNAAKGAFISKIDIESGVLSAARTLFDFNDVEIHPNSKERIKGTVIPHWDAIKNELISTHKHFPYIKFIAWDVVPIDEGFTVLEGNASSGLNIFQLWGGVRNGKIGRFYKNNRIID